MKEIKKILIAVDFDDESLEVIEYGITLGILLNAKVKCIHISRPDAVEIIEEATDIEGSFNNEFKKFKSIEDTLQEDLDSLQHLIDIVKDKIGLDTYSIETDVIAGFPIAETVSESKSWSADLIVVGMHKNPMKPGKSSIISELIDQSHCSIVIVPSTYRHRNLDKLSVFVNFQFDELNLVLDTVEVVSQHDLEIIFTHIIDLNVDLSETKNKLETYHRLFSKEIKKGNVSFQLRTKKMDDVLTSLSDEDGVDLIIIRAQKRHWSLLDLKSSETDQALKYIKIPLLIWKNNIQAKMKLVE